MEYEKNIKETEHFGNATINLHFYFSPKNNEWELFDIISGMIDDLWDTYKEIGGGHDFKEFLRKRLGIWQKLYIEGDGRE